MEQTNIKQIIEAILFATGRPVNIQELVMALEIPKEEIEENIQEMKKREQERGIEIIQMEDDYQLCSKKEYYEYIYQIIDKRAKPNLSNAALETLAIIAYNAGMGNVQQWIKDGVIKSDGSDIENIPFKETENYVRKILRDYQMYLKIYE